MGDQTVWTIVKKINNMRGSASGLGAHFRSMPVYLDHNATTHPDPRVIEAMLYSLRGPAANPSSLHRYGRLARDAVEAARAQLAALVGCQSREVVFTSGGTEADNLGLRGVMTLAPAGHRLLYGATEHPAVLETAQALAATGVPTQILAVDAMGCIDADELARQLALAPAALVAVMAANNESGVIASLSPLIALTHAHGALFHVDAVQALGRLPLRFDELDADLMAISSHKIRGPRGVGALIVREGVELAPQLSGGTQEAQRRGGTENLAAIVGFGVAAELTLAERETQMQQQLALRQRFELGLQGIPGSHIFAADVPRLPNTVLFSLFGWEGEALLMALDRKGFALSSGSACKSGSGEPSHVLLAMGVERELARGGVRLSLGAGNSEADVDAVLAALHELALSRKMPG